jgi:hypothetical protein
MYTGGGDGGFYRKALHTRVVESRIQAFNLWVMSSTRGLGWVSLLRAINNIHAARTCWFWLVLDRSLAIC